MSLKLGIGSLTGAVGGVFLQALITKSTAKTILYLVVLFSGLSILIRMWNDKRKESRMSGYTDEGETKDGKKNLTDNVVFLLVLGVAAGCICSLSGAGGPVLVMPLLVACGVSAGIAVGAFLIVLFWKLP